MKIVTVVGARPQFIKAAVLSRSIGELPGTTERLVHTGQHYDARMSDVFFDELELPRPDHVLQIGSGTHAEQTGKALIEVERVLVEEQPDLVLVYGDTNSTLAGALAAVKLAIPVAHIEAGLRSFDRSMPEEINRVMTDHVSTWHFCPTDVAVDNLRRENIMARVHQVGDVMADALAYYSRHETPSATLSEVGLQPREYALCTIHRAANTDDSARFSRLWEGIRELAEKLPVVLPLHPRTRKTAEALGLSGSPAMHLVEPVGYREMLALERDARLIVTDSGGVQKEAYLHRVPCITLRDNTEWTETVAAGWNRLVGQDIAQFLATATEWIANGPPAEHPRFYGDGNAARRILAHLGAM